MPACACAHRGVHIPVHERPSGEASATPLRTSSRTGKRFSIKHRSDFRRPDAKTALFRLFLRRRTGQTRDLDRSGPFSSATPPRASPRAGKSIPAVLKPDFRRFARENALFRLFARPCTGPRTGIHRLVGESSATYLGPTTRRGKPFGNDLRPVSPRPDRENALGDFFIVFLAWIPAFRPSRPCPQARELQIIGVFDLPVRAHDRSGHEFISG